MRTSQKNVDLLFRSSLFYAVTLWELLKIPAVVSYYLQTFFPVSVYSL
jgi:hypothetical protein